MEGAPRVERHLSFDTIADLREHLRWSPGRRPSILAHRGAPDPAHPENSIETYEQAFRAAPCYVEIDIRTSADGIFVLNHDATLDRCTTGTGPLAEHTFEQLRALHLKGAGGAATEWQMQTLDELIEWARGRTVVFLDIKGGQPHYEEVLRFVREREARAFCVTLTYCIEDTLAAHRVEPEMVVYGRATDERYARELLDSGISHDRLVAWVNDDTPQGLYDLLHERGILVTYGAFLEMDARAPAEGPGVYLQWMEKGADIINTDDVPRVAEAIAAFTAKGS